MQERIRLLVTELSAQYYSQEHCILNSIKNRCQENQKKKHHVLHSSNNHTKVQFFLITTKKYNKLFALTTKRKTNVTAWSKVIA